MNTGVAYLDASALVKLVFDEPESGPLQQFLVDWPARATSLVARVEVLRLAAGVADPVVLMEARSILNAVHVIFVTDSIVTTAIGLEPESLRALDAIHLATALSLGSDLAGMVAYDRRLARSARHAGLIVWSPS